jgi:hypothetical protein
MNKSAAVTVSSERIAREKVAQQPLLNLTPYYFNNIAVGALRTSELLLQARLLQEELCLGILHFSSSLVEWLRTSLL